MKYLLQIEYDGKNYCGWQKQRHSKTIQETIEKKLEILLRKKITIHASGRTDTGVHALNQYAHFEYEQQINKYKFLYNINALLKNETITIKNIHIVDSKFHARYSCIMKQYQYILLLDNKRNIFLNERYWMIPQFNIDIANECAKLLIGTHDFSSFRDSQCQANSPIKTIEKCSFASQNNIITMKIEAKSFLHHQIRIIIGTIVDIVLKNKTSNDFKKILDKKNRQYAKRTAPAQGLYLSWIKFYENNYS